VVSGLDLNWPKDVPKTTRIPMITAVERMRLLLLYRPASILVLMIPKTGLIVKKHADTC
jgi:hypothetical protein